MAVLWPTVKCSLWFSMDFPLNQSLETLLFSQQNHPRENAGKGGGKGGGAPSTLASWMIDDIKDLCERRGVVGMIQGFINEGYYPLVMSKELLKMSIYSKMSHEKWWFSIVMLVYQRVIRVTRDNMWILMWISIKKWTIKRYKDKILINMG